MMLKKVIPPNNEDENDIICTQLRLSSLRKLPQKVTSWNLPDDVTSDILSRLPAKSVMRCRCVCRAWRSLLSTFHFIDLHHTRASQPQNLSLLLATYSETVEKRMDYRAFFIENMLELGIIDQPLCPLQGKLVITASCNGLVCVSLDYTVLICNPVTGESMELPTSYLTVKIDYNIFGLGYHPTTKEYKVLRIAYIKASRIGVAQVYTLGDSNSWRSKGEVPFVIPRLADYVFVNRALHWLTCNPINSEDVCIPSFDIGDEGFRVLPVPPESSRVGPLKYKAVQELGGFLSLVDFSSRDHIDIWLMKDYGVKESWTKQFVVDIPEKVKSVNLLWHMEGGQVLLRYNKNTFISYDTNNNTTRHLDVQVPGTMRDSLVHVGSLVSPRWPRLQDKIEKGSLLKL